MDVTKACRDTKELSAQAQKACALFMERCKAKGLNVLITETYRSQERQDYLYQQGRTRPGKKVTWTHNSRHTSRRAWDICKNVKGQEYSDSNFFKQCGEIAKELGITWGGTWTSSPDTPHFEISADWKEPKQKDKELKDAVHKIAMAYSINESAWNSVASMKMVNVPSLIKKLGGIVAINSQITKKGMSFDLERWKYIISTGAYSANNVRSLLIKYAATL